MFGLGRSLFLGSLLWLLNIFLSTYRFSGLVQVGLRVAYSKSCCLRLNF